MSTEAKIQTIAAYDLNVAHGARLAPVVYENLVELAKEFGCVVTDKQKQFAISRAIVGEVMEERRKQVERYGHTPAHDDANPARLHDEVLQRVQPQPHTTARHALVEAAAIIVAEIEHLDRTAPPVVEKEPSDGAVYAGTHV